jgi:purine-binding chemotaxis protein CheW
MAETQYVTFTLDDQLYGVSVDHVQEVTGLSGITRVPESLPFMKGMLDLRGTVVPLIDMRLRFSFPEKSYDAQTVIIVTRLCNLLAGMIVDSVSDVASITAEDIQHPSNYPRAAESNCVMGLVRTPKGLVTLLDVAKVLSEEEAREIAATQA